METAILKSIPGLHETELGYFTNKEGIEVLLHDDPYHRGLYLRKGFKYIGKEPTVIDHHKPLSPGQMQKLIDATKGGQPQELVDAMKGEQPQADTYTCEVCGISMGNPTALGCHKRTHKKKMRRS